MITARCSMHTSISGQKCSYPPASVTHLDLLPLLLPPHPLPLHPDGGPPRPQPHPVPQVLRPLGVGGHQQAAAAADEGRVLLARAGVPRVLCDFSFKKRC